MASMISKDSTQIAYDRRGTGPAVILVGGGDFFDAAADAIAASVPRAERRIVAGQTHLVDPRALAPMLDGFFNA
jgi:hypothetical protein